MFLAKRKLYLGKLYLGMVVLIILSIAPISAVHAGGLGGFETIFGAA